MGKIFTITEGLENLGAMKTGGQGSVYKGRRYGEIITAIKLLPTPIYSENEDDKNYVDFQNEVQKLKKVNEKPNPNVVKILSSGVSDTGNFPFIEMEYIEGPDLEELIRLPHEPIFTIKEVLKVAEQLAHALAHCHKVEVRHGDIKSNNVKFNIHTYNYVLLDFGLAVMSDEQRRSSLRNAGAIEFMAPEQNEGLMLYQSDIYSYGVILFELLAGQVPFPLHDKGETARNAVRLSHMETAPPDLLALRQAAIPGTWSNDKKEHEANVPGWLVSMIYKCLEKKPEDRFNNGIELHEHIIFNSTLAAKREEATAEEVAALGVLNERLVQEKEQLLQGVERFRKETAAKDKELEELKAALTEKDDQIATLQQQQPVAETIYSDQPSGGGAVSRTAFLTLLFITILLAVFACYSLFKNKPGQQLISNSSASDSTYTDSTSSNAAEEAKTNNSKVPDPTQPGKNDNLNVVHKTPAQLKKDSAKQKAADQKVDNTTTDENKPADANPPQDNSQDDNGDHYKVVSKAFFYSEPDESTKRDAFIVHWNNAVLTPLDEKDGFIYVIYKNYMGQTSKGWLRKKDLTKVGD